MTGKLRPKDYILLIKTHGNQVVELELETFVVSTPEMVNRKGEIIRLTHTERVTQENGQREFQATKSRATGEPHH